MEAKSLNDFIEDGKRKISELFIFKKEQEFREFEAEMLHQQAVASQFRTRSENLVQARAHHQQMSEQLDFYTKADFVSSLYAATTSHPAGPLSIAGNAGNLAGDFLVKTLAPDILKKSAEVLDAREREFAEFVSEHKKTLKHLGLV